MATEEEEIGQAVRNYFNKLADGKCPFCDGQIVKEKQVGRCVYALPCYHRLFQGKAKTKEKTWRDHPYFKEGQS